MKTHKHITNQEIAKLLREIAAAYEIKNENRFRIMAYENAAASIEHATSELKDLWEQQKLRTVPGIGANLSSYLDELFKTGKVKHFLSVTKNLPQGMFELLDIPGIGPKTAFKLAKHLGLTKSHTAVSKLKAAAKKGLIQAIDGLGPETEKDILQALEEAHDQTKRIPLIHASNLSDEIVKYMQQRSEVARIDPLGSLRRRTATVGDIDISVATIKPKPVIDHFVKFPGTKEILAQGQNTARIILKNGIQVDIKTQTPDKYGALLQHFTGSKLHNIHLREIAMGKGYSLSEYGIKHQETRNKKQETKLMSFATEKDFYQALGMQWIPPELREDSGEIEAAQKNQLPHLVELKDIKGDVHTHTDYNWIPSHDSGADSIETIINEAIKLEYEYIGIGDHNPSLSSYSASEIISQIKKRQEKIEQIKSSYEKKQYTRTIKILNTLEIDLRTNGQLSVSDAGLDLLDFATVSIHSSMKKMSRKELTSRVLSGLSHPKCRILGHPTGRLINRREGYELDWETIFDFCLKNQKIIEINSQPARLDLPDVLVRDAIKHNVKLIITTDSHAAEQLSFMRFGVDVARRGWAQPKDIVNTLSWEKFSDTMNLLP